MIFFFILLLKGLYPSSYYFNLLHLRMLCAKFGKYGHTGSREEVNNIKRSLTYADGNIRHREKYIKKL